MRKRFVMQSILMMVVLISSTLNYRIEMPHFLNLGAQKALAGDEVPTPSPQLPTPYPATKTKPAGEASPNLPGKSQSVSDPHPDTEVFTEGNFTLGVSPSINNEIKPDLPSQNTSPTKLIPMLPADKLDIQPTAEPPKASSGETTMPYTLGTGWSTIMSESFEGDFPTGSWSVFDGDGSTNGEYFWNDDNYKPYNGSWSAWLANGGANGVDPEFNYYPNYARSWMKFGPFDLSDASDAELLFYYWNKSEENYDYLWWAASVDETNFYGSGVSGDSAGWNYVNFDLTSVPTLGNLTGRSSVWIAFYFESDSSNVYDGAFIDDVLLQKYTPPKPDLVPYTPSGWDFPIVPSSTTGTNTVSSLSAPQDTYIDWAAINNGVSTSNTFLNCLYYDGNQISCWNSIDGLASNYYAFVEDWQLNLTPTVGDHTLKIVADVNNDVIEEDESNNVWEHTFTWENPCYAVGVTYTGTGANPTLDVANSSGCAAGNYVAGEIITFSPQPGSGWHLQSWSGTDAADSNVLTVTGPGTVTANYEVGEFPPAATLISPEGWIDTVSPSFEWNAVSQASQYTLDVYGRNSINAVFTPAAANCESGTGTCTVETSSLGYDLRSGESTWKVLTSNSVGDGPWSDTLSFTVQASPSNVTLVSPGGTISNPRPTYTWNADYHAAEYDVYIDNILARTLSDVDANCGEGTGNCSVYPARYLQAGTHTWKVTARNDYGSATSPIKSFIQTSPLYGFNSQFNASMVGMFKVQGTWAVSSTALYSNTLVKIYSVKPGNHYQASIYYNANFSNLDYQVQVMRSGCDLCASKMFIRGDGIPVFAGWKNGYQFNIKRNGTYFVGKTVNGILTGLSRKDLEFSPSTAIKTGSNWNLLRVTAKGTSLKFYINNRLVWNGIDRSRSTGKVGVGIYSNGTGGLNRLYVNYATLTTTVLGATQAVDLTPPASNEIEISDPNSGGNW